MFRKLTQRLHSFRRAPGGNVTMMFALGAPFLCFGVAMAVDFNNATVVHTKLNEAADAAVLAALTPTMMTQSDSVAAAAAVSMFNSRAAAITSLVPNSAVATPIITHPNGAGTVRQIQLTYTAKNNTIFSGLLKQTTMTIGGSSTAKAAVPPNIDFYLLLDNSPSMSLPATTAGITQMQNLTPMQGGGCAFACHQAATNNGDSAGNLCSTGGTSPVYSSPTLNNNQYCAATNAQGQAQTQIDDYAMARKNGITLRLDELTSGVTSLMSTANKYMTSGIYTTPPAYRFAAYSMDTLWSIPTSNNQLMSLTSSYVTGWGTAKANFGVMQMYANNATCGNSACNTPGTMGDIATNYDNAMNSINNTIPTPGNGTNVAGDTPQAVLFFVTDGVEDEQNGARLIQPINANGATNYCSMLKARGVKIAILYTDYLPVPSNAFYQGYVAPILPQVSPALQACASPGLFYEAAIGADLGQALNTLFQSVVQAATLSN
ncbi:MAG: hypothetical protein KGM15_09405 [Pseudomonadota bacterium]|nr:hypothetical protein [Pseudomonadota bacterium]